jgi:F0F1-type ATP synthase membrane subunit a
MNALEYIVEFVRDSIVAPNVGNKWSTRTPLLLTFFLFATANARDGADLRRAGAAGSPCCTDEHSFRRA